MNRKDIVRKLNLSFLVCERNEQKLLSNTTSQNDIRVTFYKHIMNVLDSSIHLVIFSDTHIFSEVWWSEILPKYGIHRRMFDKEEIRSREISIDYLDQYIIFSYYLFVVSVFEHSIRVICKHSFPNIYYYTTTKGDERMRDFKTQFEMLVKELMMMNTNLQNFIEIVVKFRNSIHNNGVYINENGNSPIYLWDDVSYEFKNGDSIRVRSNDLWSDYSKFTDELIRVFGAIADKLSATYIEDITEPK